MKDELKGGSEWALKRDWHYQEKSLQERGAQPEAWGPGEQKKGTPQHLGLPPLQTSALSPCPGPGPRAELEPGKGKQVLVQGLRAIPGQRPTLEVQVAQSWEGREESHPALSMQIIKLKAHRFA